VLLSFLQVALTIRAIMRSVAERYVLGIVGGLARVALMGLGAVASLGQMSIVMLPGITLKSPATHDPSVLASVGLLLAGVGGPLLTFVVVWTAHRATRDIPAAQEERASRPFMAWVPVAVHVPRRVDRGGGFLRGGVAASAAGPLTSAPS
jgi:hypothetical protein